LLVVWNKAGLEQSLRTCALHWRLKWRLRHSSSSSSAYWTSSGHP